MYLIFEVIQHRAGGYSASCLNADIDTRAVDLEELDRNITAAVDLNFAEGSRPTPDNIHLLLFRE